MNFIPLIHPFGEVDSAVGALFEWLDFMNDMVQYVDNMYKYSLIEIIEKRL